MQHRRQAIEDERSANRLERASLGLEVVDLLVQVFASTSNDVSVDQFLKIDRERVLVVAKLKWISGPVVPEVAPVCDLETWQAPLKPVGPVRSLDVHFVRVRTDVDPEVRRFGAEHLMGEAKVRVEKQRRAEKVRRAEAEYLGSSWRDAHAASTRRAAAGISQGVRIVNQRGRTAVAAEGRELRTRVVDFQVVVRAVVIQSARRQDVVHVPWHRGVRQALDEIQRRRVDAACRDGVVRERRPLRRLYGLAGADLFGEGNGMFR